LIHLETHGSVPDEEAAKIRNLLEECYDRLRPDGLDLVEVMIFENDRMWRSHFATERRKAGVTSSEFDEVFMAAHDAWTGIPRISISLERKQELPDLVWEGALRHEVGHSILHGGLEYYIFPMPRDLSKAANRFPALTDHLTDILYLLTLAVKDMEVTRLLVSNGYVEDQAAYARFVLRPTEQDLDAWAISALAAEARVLCLVGRLKDIAAAMVLASRPDEFHVSQEEMDQSVGYLPRDLREALLDTTTKILKDIGKDTFANIQTAGALLAAGIVEPAMRGSSSTQGC